MITNHTKRRHRRERMVAIQSILYTGAFLLCWIGPTVFHLAGWIGGYNSFVAAAVIVIFTPLQGFFNVIILGRPTYIRLKHKYPHLTFWESFHLIFFTEDPFADTHLLERQQHNTIRANNNDAGSSAGRFGGTTSSGGGVGSLGDATGNNSNGDDKTESKPQSLSSVVNNHAVEKALDDDGKEKMALTSPINTTNMAIPLNEDGVADAESMRRQQQEEEGQIFDSNYELEEYSVQLKS